MYEIKALREANKHCRENNCKKCPYEFNLQKCQNRNNNNWVLFNSLVERKNKN